eukprot:TRINITY_DN1730_c0_g1_i1.p1 TRINITY_DN1730_c0_g1~~TRINITY_DN1730_c0_g1_i1.p1  ORF type:complete len:569 (-),score=75.11 TRINITY_DN1730_c0_g1_i1:227-1933(-)
MKSFYQIIFALFILSVSHTNGYACYNMYNIQSCIEDALNPFYCAHIQGIYSEESCESLGYEIGYCCFPDQTCARTDMDICLILVEGGQFHKDGCNCPFETSCCVKGSCKENVTEVQCLSQNGTFANVSCAVGRCNVIGQPMGACCSPGKNCYEMPKPFCHETKTWYEGQTCSKACVDTPLIENMNDVPYNASSPGRCCSHICQSTNEYGNCSKSKAVYQEGYECYADYPCDSFGVCITDDRCASDVPKPICIGTFIEGGHCPIEGACYIEDYCKNIFQEVCLDQNGTFFEGEKCPDWTGACCLSIPNEPPTCSVKKTMHCAGGYYNGTTCEDQVCPDVSCCLSGVYCIEMPQIACYGVINQGGICPASRSCSGDGTVKIQDKTVIIDVDMEYDNIVFTTNNSGLTSNSLLVNNSLLVLSQSFFDMHVFTLRNSVIELDLTANITISGCLDIDNNTLIYLNYTEEESKEKAESNASVTLISYSNLCAESPPGDLVVCSNNVTTTLSFKSTQLVMTFSLTSCTDNNNTDQDPGIYILIIIIAIIIVAGATVGVLFIPAVNKIVFPYRRKT